MLPPASLIMLHAPLPIAAVFLHGALPIFPQAVVWSRPALAVVGDAGKVISTSSVELHEPLVVVHISVYVVPVVLLNADVGEADVVILTPAQLIMLHAPLPLAGVFPARFAV